MIRAIPFWLALSACGGGGGGEDDTGPSGDADTDADGDADPDACPAHAGMREEGTRWTWTYTEAYEEETGQSGGWTVLLRREGDGWVAFHEGATVNAWTGMDYDWTSSYTYTCDLQGLWLTAAETAYTYESGTVEGDGWADTTYAEPALVLPRELAVGTAWTLHAVGTVESEGAVSDFDYVTENEVVGEASRTVPAGTFDTLEIAWTMDASSGRWWAARSVGSVDTVQAVLQSWSGGRSTTDPR